MGQKIHPYGLRLGIVTDWKSRWYSDKDYADQVSEDNKIRRYLHGELKRGAVSRIDIERIGDKKVQIDVHTARPGVVIGRSGSEAERLRSGLENLTSRMVKFNVIEVQNPELDAKLLSRSVADQLEGRVSFRRAMKRAVSTALKAGAEGVRVQASGRLGGADMGRREWYLEGRVPLHTLRADIDFGQSTAQTTVGAIGVKVWVYKGDVLPSLQSSREKIAAEARLAAGGPAKRRRAPAKSRAEQAAGSGGGRRLIEAGGGKRIVEAGGGKRREGGRRLIEAGGGKRISTAEAKGEFEEARVEAEETLAAPAPGTGAEAVTETAAAVEAAVGAAPETPEEAAPETPEEAAPEETEAQAETEAAPEEAAPQAAAEEAAPQAAAEEAAPETAEAGASDDEEVT
ncbi:MAG: 30S ribosomal protein S3 [Acidimicrobiia bacterium]|jgi:small subunit ribosomal protein S3